MERDWKHTFSLSKLFHLVSFAVELCFHMLLHMIIYETMHLTGVFSSFFRIIFCPTGSHRVAQCRRMLEQCRGCLEDAGTATCWTELYAFLSIVKQKYSLQGFEGWFFFIVTNYLFCKCYLFLRISFALHFEKPYMFDVI
uniref:Uncharacterized protein n=1 Tax=Anguilla anguilla TaxID=7936 RepID=A0A0E9X652_ANGAN